MTAIASITTAAQLLEAPDLGRCELIEGDLIMMSPAGYEHGDVIAEITRLLGNHVRSQKLGRVMGAETGFQIGRDPDTVRAPDVAFIRSERVPRQRVRGFFQGPPDLAVEVLSPNDRASDVQAKVFQWLEAGCRAVWVVDPETRTVTLYNSRTEIVALTDADTLSGGNVLPGFSVPVADIFA